jgi:hypothetical protein
MVELANITMKGSRMTESIHNTYYPLSAEDIHYINFLANHAANRRQPTQLDISDHHQLQNNNFIRRALISDLRQLFTAPAEASTKKVAKIFRDINNIHRMRLLSLRPALIRNCDELEFILRESIPLKDRLLFACSQIHLLYDADIERCMDNTNAITRLIPWNEVEKFHSFAAKMMVHKRKQLLPAKETAPDLSTENALSAHAYSFTAGFIFAAANLTGELLGAGKIFDLATMLATIGNLAYGCYDLYQQQPVRKELAFISNHVYTMWHQIKYYSNLTTETPVPRL